MPIVHYIRARLQFLSNVAVPAATPGSRRRDQVDARLTDIKYEATGADLEDTRWRGLPMRSGSVGIDPMSADAAASSQHAAGHGISGRLKGPNMQELLVGLVAWRPCPAPMQPLEFLPRFRALMA